MSATPSSSVSASAETATDAPRRAKDLRYTDINYDQAAIPQLPQPPEDEEIIIKPERVPSPQPTDPQQQAAPGGKQPNYPISPIPSALSWVLGFMALLLFLIAVGMFMANFWDSIPMMVRVASLCAVPLLLWFIYVIGFNKGYRAPELAALLAAISWLDAVLIYQFCIQAMPLWVAASVLTLGLMAIPSIKPWKMAVYSLAAAGALQFGLMGWGLAHASTYGEWSLIWASALSMMMLWSHIGVWCSYTKRSGYAEYSKLAPLAQALFMLMLISMLVYPRQLLPSEIDSTSTIGDWFGIIAIWALAIFPVFPLQKHFACLNNRPTISNSFLLYLGISIITVPLGLALAWYAPNLMILPLSLVYLFSMIYYGAEYKVPRMVLMGSIGVFLSLVSIPYHAGTGLLGSAIIMLVLSVMFLFAMMWLNTYRKLLIARKRQEAAELHAATQQALPQPHFKEKERMEIMLPRRDS